MQSNPLPTQPSSDVSVLTPAPAQLTPLDIPSATSTTTSVSTTTNWKDFYNKNKKLVWASVAFLIVLFIFLALLIISANQKPQTVVPTPTPIVSSPVSRPVARTETETPTSPTSKTIDFTVDSAFAVSQQPYSTLHGTIDVSSEVNFINPTQYTGVFKKGTSSLTISNFYEEFQSKLIDAVSVGQTKTLGDTYRVSKMGETEGQVKYFYVNKDAVVLTGSCNPTSYPDPIEAPCGVTNYKGYYFQCTGDTNFTFCDSIIKDLDFTITIN